MKGLLYTITLEEPVLANSLGGEPNSAHSLFYIPGSLIRGALIAEYIRKKSGQEHPPLEEDKQFRAFFFEGDVRFLNAYPLVDGKLSWPAPMNWRVKRKAASSEDQVVYFGIPSEQDTQGVPFEFWCQNGAEYLEVEEEWQINVHTQRDAMRGRATSEAGAVFRYIALPSGLHLLGALLVDDDIQKSALKALLPDTILLGKARTAGYGRARVTYADLPPSWRGLPASSPTTSKNFTLTLLSPALVRDENGQFSLDITTALEARVGKIASIVAFRKQAVVGGYNRTWGLPLPQQIAIAAGSVFEVETESPVSAQALAQLEETGIGERRVEGFGCLAVNLAFPDQAKYKSQPLILTSGGANGLPGADPTALLMLTRRMRGYLDEQVIKAAQHAATMYEKDKIPNSQLSRWRVILRDALGKLQSQDPLERLKQFVLDNRGKPGWEKMSRARVAVGNRQPRLSEWIEKVLDDPQTLHEALGEASREKMSLGTNSVQASDFNLEYRLRLLDAVLAMLAKKNSEGGKNA